MSSCEIYTSLYTIKDTNKMEKWREESNKKTWNFLRSARLTKNDDDDDDDDDNGNSDVEMQIARKSRFPQVARLTSRVHKM